jgi:hypothetical protein
MTLLHADGFDHWGSLANMQIGGWFYETNDATNASVSGINPRTGVYCLLFPNEVSSGYNRFRFIWDAATSTIGLGVAHYIPSAYLAEGHGFQFQDAGANNLITVTFNTNGGFTVYKLSAGDPFAVNMGSSLVNVVVPGSYNYVEVACKIHLSAGFVEIRVNGATVLTIVGNTGTTGTLLGGVRFGKVKTSFSGSEVGVDMRLDDLVIWDDTGTMNNGFLGDVRCDTLFPNADTVTADWTPSSGTDGFALIDEVPPNTAGYIEAEQPGDISEFEKTGVSIDATSVAAVQLFSLAQKTDSGPSTFRMGVQSAANVENSPIIAPGTGFAFYNAIFELNPNGDIPWTKTALNLANIRLTRED